MRRVSSRSIILITLFSVCYRRVNFFLWQHNSRARGKTNNFNIRNWFIVTLFNQLCKYLKWINFLHNNISRTINVHTITTACIVFLLLPSLRQNFQRCHLLSLEFIKCIFVILAVTRIREKIHANLHENIHLFVQREVDSVREYNDQE
jgi:hypothetical protein